QSHEGQTPPPDFERLMMARKKGVCQSIQAWGAGSTLIALACRFRSHQSRVDDLGRLARGTRKAVWPAQLADGLVTLRVIDPMRDIDLPHGTPGRGWDRGCHPYTTSSHTTTLESKKSVVATSYF